MLFYELFLGWELRELRQPQRFGGDSQEWQRQSFEQEQQYWGGWGERFNTKERILQKEQEEELQEVAHNDRPATCIFQRWVCYQEESFSWRPMAIEIWNILYLFIL